MRESRTHSAYVGAVGLPEHGVDRDPDARQGQPGQGGGADAHRRVALDRQAVGAGLDEHQAPGWPSSMAPTTKSSASPPRATSDFTPSRTRWSPSRVAVVVGCEHVEEHGGLVERQRRRPGRRRR